MAEPNDGCSTQHEKTFLTPHGTVQVLDGGMGHQLKAMGVKIEGIVGSMERFLGVALANLRKPTLVRDAHIAYIDAGADIITTNNYAVVPACLSLCEDFEGDESTICEFVAAAGQCARAACKARPHRRVLVAGCLPPLHESYRADRVGTFEENLDQYRLIAKSIAPFADVLLCETLSTAEEALAASQAALETEKPVWVSWTLSEENPVLRSGETIHEALKVLKHAGIIEKIKAFFFNCTSPEIISVALPLLLTDPLLPEHATVGAYANGFITASSGTGQYRDLSPVDYFETFVKKWVQTIEDSGRSASADNFCSRRIIIGGCCGIFPRHIAQIRRGIDTLARRKTSVVHTNKLD